MFNSSDFIFAVVGDFFTIQGKSLRFMASYNDYTQISLCGINGDYLYDVNTNTLHDTTK